MPNKHMKRHHQSPGKCKSKPQWHQDMPVSKARNKTEQQEQTERTLPGLARAEPVVGPPAAGGGRGGAGVAHLGSWVGHREGRGNPRVPGFPTGWRSQGPVGTV